MLHILLVQNLLKIISLVNYIFSYLKLGRYRQNRYKLREDALGNRWTKIIVEMIPNRSVRISSKMQNKVDINKSTHSLFNNKITMLVTQDIVLAAWDISAKDRYMCWY